MENEAKKDQKKRKQALSLTLPPFSALSFSLFFHSLPLLSFHQHDSLFQVLCQCCFTSYFFLPIKPLERLENFLNPSIISSARFTIPSPMSLLFCILILFIFLITPWERLENFLNTLYGNHFIIQKSPLFPIKKRRHFP